MKTIQQFFKAGLDRTIPDLLSPPDGRQINLGPGNKKEIYYRKSRVESAELLEGVGGGELSAHPDWWWPRDPLPYQNGSVAAVHCYQFIEHFDGDDAVALLRECERVLMPGGVMYIVTPHASSSMSWQALDHKTHWNEEVWNWMFGNEYYDSSGGDCQLRVHCCFIMGVVIRNLNLFSQLYKEM
jgi:SAM-dependent methyltransferase